MTRIVGLFVAILLLGQCDNLYSPLTTDRELSAQGRLERAKRYLAEGNYRLANQDVGGALSLDSSLSEAYYLRAQIALWQYKTAISEVRGAVAAMADTNRTDSSEMPFSDLKYARIDSILQGNLIALENLEILRGGKAPGAGITLDSLYRFSDLYLDYVVACEVLGITSLFDLDTNAEIDSLDSLGLVGLTSLLTDTGFALRAASDANPDTLIPAINQSRVYFAKANTYVDSIVFAVIDSSKTAQFRRGMQETIQEFLEDLPHYASKRGLP